ncbi:hypothetical protein [Streptomyces sp. SS]|uniref:hypothetical protein n=1 Tax=Streptomyces sp. SS TaxID=260742 RepID=UPI0002D9A800|nr:hypothetical protein [Streptomyces sp. SS]
MSQPEPTEPPRRRSGFGALHSWIATITGLAALVLSIFNFWLLQRDPRVDASLPAVLRIAGGADFTHIYLQPTLSTSQDTDGVDVVETLKFRLHDTSSDPGTSDPEFIWDESGKWQYYEPTDALNYFPDGDPVAMVVARDTPQRPVVRFVARGWRIAAGRYDAVLEVHRGSDETPLLKHFCLSLSPSDISILAKDHKGFYFFRNDTPQAADNDGCYTRFTYSQPSRGDTEGSSDPLTPGSRPTNT